MRDDFPTPVKELLAKRVGYRCSNPSCRQLTSGPQEDSEKSVNIGVAAHITAASADGPRYDSTLAPEQRKSQGNGIWLCQKCGKLVDNDPKRYSVLKLREWRRTAEEAAIQEVEGKSRVNPQLLLSELGSRFENELANRNLGDPESPSFGKTKYSARLGWINERREAGPLPVTAIIFAFMPRPIVSATEKPALLNWMTARERRYEPCYSQNYLPSSIYSEVSKGYLWDNSMEIQTPQKLYSRYVAVEPGGWIENGFYPGAGWEDETDRLYYARVIASIVGFLHFVRDAAQRFQVNAAEIGLGFALIGTVGKDLLCVREEGFRKSFHVSPPSMNTFRFIRAPDKDDWTVDEVAQDAAVEILDHWSFHPEFWVTRPEFENGVYAGVCFRKRFQGYW